MRVAGTLHIRGGGSEGGRYGLDVRTTVQAVARRFYLYLKGMGVDAELAARREARFQRRLVYEVRLPGAMASVQALNELGVVSDAFRLEAGIPRRFVSRPCCRAAFLRGAFLGAGSVNAPEHDAHLEFVLASAEFAEHLRLLLAGVGLRAGVYARREAYVVYVKGREEVAGVLALAGAQQAALTVEEGAVLKEVRAQANRVANCDEANVRRASTAAQLQLGAIDYLERVGMLQELPPALQEAADLRRACPYLTLGELAEENAGLTRSALAHRMRRVVEAAEAAGFPLATDREAGEARRSKKGR